MEEGFDGLPKKENVNLPGKWRSSYHAAALHTLEKITDAAEIQPKKEKLGRYLDAIDTEVTDNFEVFESQKHPGVRFPHTSISISKVAGLAQNHPISPDQEAALGEKLTYVIFTPFSPQPGGGPDDVMNAVYDRVITVLPEIKNHPAKDITVHVLGLPTSKWGSVSQEWVRGLEKDGFSQHGKLYAEFLRTVFPQNQIDLQNMRIRFYGSSMGSILASETAKQFPEIWNKRVLVDVPTGTHKPPFITTKHFPLSPRGIQAATMFWAEARLRMWFDDLVRTAFAGKKKAREELAGVLRERGIIPYESEAENMLKKDAFWQEIKLLIRGTPLDTDDFRSYVVQGILDPATITPKRALSLMIGKKLFKAGNRSFGIGINYSHWMDRGRWVDRWIRVIERYES